VVAAHLQHLAAGQADEAVAAPLVAAVDGFQQVGIGLVGELEIDPDGGVEIARQFARERDAVIGRRHQTSF